MDDSHEPVDALVQHRWAADDSGAVVGVSSAVADVPVVGKRDAVG
ncbi:MAG: hypothetical protein ACJAV2_000677, partial [Myxococcota bacterium]